MSDEVLAELYCYKTIRLSHKGDTGNALRFGALAIEHAGNLQREEQLAKATLITGHVKYHAGEYRSAIELLLSIEPDGLYSNDRLVTENNLIIRSRAVAAGCQAYVGDFPGARDLIQEALDYVSNQENLIDLGVSAYFNSLICRKIDEIEHSTELLDQAIDLCRQAQLDYMLPWLWLESALVVGRSEPSRAMPLTVDAEQLAAKLDLHYLLTLVFCCRSTLYRRLSLPDDAAATASKSIRLASNYGYHGLRAYSLANFGLATYLQNPKRVKVATEYVKSAEEIAEVRGMLPLLAKCLAYQGYIVRGSAPDLSDRLLQQSAESHIAMGMYGKSTEILGC